MLVDFNRNDAKELAAILFIEEGQKYYGDIIPMELLWF